MKYAPTPWGRGAARTGERSVSGSFLDPFGGKGLRFTSDG